MHVCWIDECDLISIYIKKEYNKIIKTDIVYVHEPLNHLQYAR